MDITSSVTASASNHSFRSIVATRLHSQKNEMITRASASTAGGASLRPRMCINNRRDAPAAVAVLSANHQPRAGGGSARNGDHEVSRLRIDSQVVRAHRGSGSLKGNRNSVTVATRASSSGSSTQAVEAPSFSPFPPFLPQRDVQELNDEAARRLAARIKRLPIQAGGCVALYYGLMALWHHGIIASWHRGIIGS